MCPGDLFKKVHAFTLTWPRIAGFDPEVVSNSHLLPQHQATHSCTPCRCKSSSRRQRTVSFGSRRGNASCLMRILKELEIYQTIFPFCPLLRLFFPFFCSLLAHHVTYWFSQEGKGAPSTSSSVKAKDLPLKSSEPRHTQLFKFWPDTRAEHSKQLSTCSKRLSTTFCVICESNNEK